MLNNSITDPKSSNYSDYDEEWYRGENSFVDDADYDDRKYWSEVEEDDAYDEYIANSYDD